MDLFTGCAGHFLSTRDMVQIGSVCAIIFFGGRLRYWNESGEASAAAAVMGDCSAYTPRYSGGSIEAMLRMTWSVVSSISSRLIFSPRGLKTMGSPYQIVTRGRNSLNT